MKPRKDRGNGGKCPEQRGIPHEVAMIKQHIIAVGFIPDADFPVRRDQLGKYGERAQQTDRQDNHHRKCMI
jgi:hypothetical protein